MKLQYGITKQLLINAGILNGIEKICFKIMKDVRYKLEVADSILPG